ncbi:hypothetical protein HZA55_08375 [Candidatus Poribacteria bacterium]|nr:hypothetical protein [Candidatus Poribacteria bacterium]
MPLAIVFLLVSAGLIYIFFPVFNKQQNAQFNWNKKTNIFLELEDRKLEIFGTLRDMELDFATGKTAKEDFEDSWKNYKSNAIKIMKEIDKLKSEKQRAK